jgi:hypothetical protein
MTNAPETAVSLCLRLYRVLARSFPYEFRSVYGDGNAANRRGCD